MPLGHETLLADHARLELADAQHQVPLLLGNRFLEHLVVQRVVRFGDQPL